MISYLFNGDTYYSENDVNKAIVDYIYRTESVGDIDVEETTYFAELWETVVELKGVTE
jgi:hypothetical protein